MEKLICPHCSGSSTLVELQNATRDSQTDELRNELWAQALKDKKSPYVLKTRRLISTVYGLCVIGFIGGFVDIVLVITGKISNNWAGFVIVFALIFLSLVMYVLFKEERNKKAYLDQL